MLLTLSVLWGGSFFFIGVVVSELPPLTIVTLRVALAALALWGFVLVKGSGFPKSIEIWKAFFVMGLLNNVLPFSLIVWGQTHIASGLASILNATTPLFTIVVAGFILPDERITRMKLIGVMIGFSGVVLMIGPSALDGLGANVFAQIAILGAATSYAFSGVFGRRFNSMGVQPVVIAAGQVTASTLILAPIAFYIDRPLELSMPSITTWAAMFGLAVLSTSLAYILFFRLLASAGATNALLVTFLVPVSAIILGALFLGERLGLIHFAGMLLIALGFSAVDGRLWQKKTGGDKE